MPALPPERPRCPNAPGGRRPLPDPAAVRLCFVPDPAPPYDEDLLPGGRDRSAGAAREHHAGGPRGRGQSSGGPGRVAGGGPGGGPAPRDARPGPAASPPALPPGWQSRFAQVLAETLAGSRPPRQLTPWTTEEARSHIRRLGPRLASVQRPQVRRVVTFHPTADVMEMTVVVRFGTRVKAVAARLERAGPCPPRGPGAPSPGRWLCTAVEAA